jgi:oligopeptide transport system ATP-binding protein
MPLLKVSSLEVQFDTPEGVVKAVNGMDFQLNESETLAIVGESGSGKSQLVMAIMGLLAENGSASGRAEFHGRDLMQMAPKELNAIRGRHIAMIFQDPMTSLNPFLTIEKQMIEVVMHHQGLSRDEARAHAVEMLRAVRIPDPEERIRQYPHEYSGGMRQRVMIAMGLLCEPEVLIADEPVMYAGELVETGSAEDIFYRPQHPYTRGLLASVPRLDRVSDDELQAIPGNPPNLQDLPTGCRFRDRCSQAMDECLQRPPLWVSEDGRMSRCFLPMEGGRIANAGASEGDAE